MCSQNISFATRPHTSSAAQDGVSLKSGNVMETPTAVMELMNGLTVAVVSVCVYVCMYVCTCMYVRVCVHAWMCMCLCVHACVCVFVCVCAHVHVCKREKSVCASVGVF